MTQIGCDFSDFEALSCNAICSIGWPFDCCTGKTQNHTNKLSHPHLTKIGELFYKANCIKIAQRGHLVRDFGIK